MELIERLSEISLPNDGLGHARIKVLVTGGGGFIGRHVTRALLASDHSVRVLDDFSASAGRVGSFPPNVSVIRGSVTDRRTVEAAADGVDIVLHLAGVVGMRLAVRQAADAYRLAVDGTRAVLSASSSTPLVLFSSSAVYGLSDRDTKMCERQRIRRDVPLEYDGGTEGYATGKWDMERLATESENDNILVVRPFNVIGRGQSSSYGMVVPTFMEKAENGLPVMVHGDGHQRRSFTDVAQFTQVLLRLIRTPAAWRRGSNVFNIGSDLEMDIGSLARLMIDAVDSTSEVRYVPYNYVYPGRRDVAARMPCQKRLAATIGDVSWSPISEIIAGLVHPHPLRTTYRI